MKRKLKSVEEAARQVIATWRAWGDAEGWDNPGYDPFMDALHELEKSLEAEAKRPPSLFPEGG